MGIEFWTETRIANLSRLYDSGFSFAQIAAEIGGGISRNACIGKHARMFGSSRLKAKPRADTTKRVRTTGVGAQVQAINRRSAEVKPVPFIVSADDIVPLRIELLALDVTHCRYPYDAVEGETGSFVFCGHPKHGERSWCPGHAALCRTPPPQRKPPQAPLKVAAAPSRFGGGRAA